MKVLKFGGTSVGSVSALKTLFGIVKDAMTEEPVAVVVSAMSGVTNLLLDAAHKAGTKDHTYQDLAKEIADRHFTTAAELLSPIAQSANYAQLRLLTNELEDVLHGIYALQECSLRSLDKVASFGERLSATLVAAYLTDAGIPATMLDARQLIVTDLQYTSAKPDLVLSYKHIYAAVDALTTVPIITGFLGASSEGITTTLGRGGSDFTAAIVGAALNASVIEIWTDVSGMLTADPRKVAKAYPQPEVSYQEAMELSHFGAKVIYPPTLLPAIQKNIPIRIANTFAPEDAGTLIHAHAKPGDKPVRGISSIGSVVLLNVQGAALSGVAGMAGRLFTALAQAKVNVILISQASSEQSICLALAPADGVIAQKAIAEVFAQEIQIGIMEPPTREHELSVLAVVGEGMRTYAGVSAKLFKTLGNNGVNVRAAAQGSSELNISVVIAQADLEKALNAVHDAFFLDRERSLNLVLIGPGLIGKTLLKQLEQQHDFLGNTLKLDVKLVGIMNSRKQVFKSEGIELDNWSATLEASQHAADLPTFIRKVTAANLPNLVVADCTSTGAVSLHYADLLKHAISIVTPNKIANSGPLSQYKHLQGLAHRHNAFFLYETNVGAGLPIINTLQGLVQSGDPIVKIEAVLSGTLSFLFNTFGPEVSFHDAVKQAQDAGYTEPDPRDDLSGLDMARKVLILAREIGLEMESTDIRIDPIVPAEAASAPSIPAFYEALQKHEDYFLSMASHAASSGKKLRYLASITEGKASISLQEVGPESPFYALNGSENMVVFTTMRYSATPLVVKGPGAGADVTAAGVFADIVKCGLR